MAQRIPRTINTNPTVRGSFGADVATEGGATCRVSIFDVSLSSFSNPKAHHKTYGARKLADRQDKYPFQYWACALVGAQPYRGGKKGADTGIDGITYFQDDKQAAKKIIVSVKGGANVGVTMLKEAHSPGFRFSRLKDCSTAKRRNTSTCRAAGLATSKPGSKSKRADRREIVVNKTTLAFRTF